MTDLITFAIPYYNGRDYLKMAIQSVIRQTNPHWLLIVVDDCGGEDASELVASFSDPRISYFKNANNLGISGNWNRALSLATTEFVTLLHADDELEETYTDEMVSLMLRHPKAVAGHCRTTIIDEDGKHIISFPDEIKKIIRPKSKSDIVTFGEDGLLSLVKGVWIFCPTMCYRKNHLPIDGFSNGWKMVLDFEMMSRILLSGGQIVGTHIVAYRYRRHSNNQTVQLTKSMLRFREEIEILNSIESLSSTLGWHRVATSARRKIIVRLNLLYESCRSLCHLKFARSRTLFAAAVTLQIS